MCCRMSLAQLPADALVQVAKFTDFNDRCATGSGRPKPLRRAVLPPLACIGVILAARSLQCILWQLGVVRVFIHIGLRYLSICNAADHCAVPSYAASLCEVVGFTVSTVCCRRLVLPLVSRHWARLLKAPSAAWDDVIIDMDDVALSKDPHFCGMVAWFRCETDVS